MNDTTYFERLKANIIRIADHPGFATKQQVVEQCLEDIDDLRLAGQITPEQAGILRRALGQAA